ncbi:MAG: hypothetical protein KDJ72_05825 [Methyloceanibacter sp.]|uniref:hypothetical protein n=1 Tax=Methyloceanibacter sp. TaxID=1965321 RepID=UPI001D5C08B8|nr:hypothetical protein [Methyloceanibacter sp.]MCB1442523.1 hypothetical protein [Methyloceanibacter sp.]
MTLHPTVIFVGDNAGRSVVAAMKAEGPPMENDKKNRDLKLEDFLARESVRRKRAAALRQSSDGPGAALDRLVAEERDRRIAEEEGDNKKR